MSSTLLEIAARIGIDQEELEAVISKVAHNHRHKHFGYFTEEDIFGEVWVICLKQLQHYQPQRGKGDSPINNLERWLNKVVRNRLANLYRDRYSSVNDKYRRTRMNIMNTLPFDVVDTSRESKGWGYTEDVSFDACYQEFFDFVEERLGKLTNNEELLNIFFDCLYSESVTPYYRNKLKAALIPIIEEWRELHGDNKDG
jgi:hypothetical protein